MDAMHGDLTRAPLAYPLVPVDGPRLVLAGCEHPVRPRHGHPLGRARATSCPACAELPGSAAGLPLRSALAALDVAPLADRTPVLAVGSNAASPVIRHKLVAHGASTVVPVVTGLVRGLGVAHSAHVARGGYVPAAPVHVPSARTRVVLQLLDDDQLAAVDATEPNYDRVEVTASRYPLVLTGGARPRRVHLYASRRGVLDLPGQAPRSLLPQRLVLSALGAAGVPHTSGHPEEVSARLASSPEVRDAVHRALDDLGLVRASGLHAAPANRLRWQDPARTERPRRGTHRPRTCAAARHR